MLAFPISPFNQDKACLAVLTNCASIQYRNQPLGFCRQANYAAVTQAFDNINLGINSLYKSKMLLQKPSMSEMILRGLLSVRTSKLELQNLPMAFGRLLYSHSYQGAARVESSIGTEQPSVCDMTPSFSKLTLKTHQNGKNLLVQTSNYNTFRLLSWLKKSSEMRSTSKFIQHAGFAHSSSSCAATPEPKKTYSVSVCHFIVVTGR